VPIPEVIIPIIRWHLACFTGPATKSSSSTARPENRCGTATSDAGHGCLRSRAAELSAIHFHDLRHTGNTLAANAGASLRELMDRMATTVSALR